MNAPDAGRLETILWATDGSPAADRALAYAKSLAVQYGATLVVMHSEDAQAEQEVKAKLLQVVAELRGEGLAVRSRIVSDPMIRPAHKICEVAREAGVDVIVVGTRGRTPLEGLVLGSVTQRLLHIAPCPVLAVPPP